MFFCLWEKWEYDSSSKFSSKIIPRHRKKSEKITNYQKSPNNFKSSIKIRKHFIVFDEMVSFHSHGLKIEGEGPGGFIIFF